MATSYHATYPQAPIPSTQVKSLANPEVIPQWYAVYTRSRHEKQVHAQLQGRSIQSFLPLYETIHRWKDRKMRVQLPLFPGYVFVRIMLDRQLEVLQVPGVARIVGFNGRPVAMKESDIETVQRSLSLGTQFKPCAYLAAGSRVRINSGPLIGLEGILVRARNRVRVVVSICLLERSVEVDVGLSGLEPVTEIGARHEKGTVS